MPSTPLNPTMLVARGKWNDYRDEIWGDSLNWAWVRAWSQIEGILIHHSVTTHTATPDDIALLHKARGWAGVGYHFIIDKSGVVYYVGDISTARAHVANKNEKYLGICMIGDFTKHLPSDDQIISAHDLCLYFQRDVPAIPTLATWNQLGGHKDQQATACPGTSWPVDMRQRIIERRPYCVVTPPTTDIRLTLLNQASITDEAKTRLAIERYNKFTQLETDKTNLQTQYNTLKTRIKAAVNTAIDQTS